MKIFKSIHPFAWAGLLACSLSSSGFGAEAFDGMWRVNATTKTQDSRCKDRSFSLVVEGGHVREARLTAMVTGPGYECRKRTGDGSGKMSEHAFGNAVDIAGLTFSTGRRLEIADAGFAQSPANRMLAALRISACGYFTTVLGPGSNAAHASHFHFDSGRHGKSSNYRICE